MASKYAGLKGKVPTQPTERDQAIKDALQERSEKTIAELTAEYNALGVEGAKLAADVKVVANKYTAVEILIKERLDAIEGDAVTMNGYTWSPTFEPYPVCEDPAAIVEYFKTHGMEQQLNLSNSELASRLKSLVKAESLANELIIGTRMVPNPNGEGEVEVPDVRSNVPGVRVFLKAGLSRVKARAAKE